MSVHALNDSLLLVKQEKINPEKFIKVTSGALSVIVLLYNAADQKLQYNTDQLLAALGYDDDITLATTFDIQQILHPNDVVVFNKWLQLLSDEQVHKEPMQVRLRNGNSEYAHCYMSIAGQDLTGSYLITLFNKPFKLVSEPVKGNAIRKTIDDLQNSNRELEDFAYVASHDLQEPLRKISTFSNMLVNKYGETLEDDAKMYLSRIVAGSENMRLFIDNLLDFSRIARVKETFEQTDLNFVLQQVLADLELKIEETGTKIHAAKLPVINASATQVKQLFNNIINNAIKFRKPGMHSEIHIDTEILSHQDVIAYGLQENVSYHRISISDNGIGFEKEYAKRIFQVFQRLHGKSEYPGSGIGLAICKKIADYHKGHIYAEQTAEGACFYVIFPADLSLMN